MENNLSIVESLIQDLKTFEKDHQELTYDRFIDYLYLQKQNRSINDERVHSSGELTFLLLSVSRYLKNDIVSLLKGEEVKSYDEFSFLAHIHHLASVRKMDLAKMHLMSNTSGFEVVKKLLKADLIKEIADTEDKRATRVEITKKGEEILQKLNPIITDFLKDRFKKVKNLNETVEGLSSLI